MDLPMADSNLQPLIKVQYFDDNFYTSTKSWRGYIFTAVCLCVCLCVCVCVRPDILVNEIPAERMHRFGRGFR